MPLLCAIDPGNTGAIAFLDMDTKDVHAIYDMPTVQISVGGKNRNKISPNLVVDIVKRHTPTKAIIEEVGVMKTDGSLGAFTFGRGVGILEGIFAGLEIPATNVRPQTWKRVMDIPADKGGARIKAMALFPKWSQSFARVKDDGRAEACLIGLYGLRG